MKRIISIYISAVIALIMLNFLSWELPDWLLVIDAGLATWNAWSMVMNFVWWLEDDLTRIQVECALHNEEIAYRRIYERLLRLYGVPMSTKEGRNVR